MKALMKRTVLFCLILNATFIVFLFPQVPFHRGVNLTGWFQAGSPEQIQFTRYTRKDFENIKSLGCDVIRLPINLHAMTNGSPDYIPHPLFLQFLDSAVTWSEELQIHLIIDNHTFDPSASTDPNIGNILNKVWNNMARHYKNRSQYIYYEILNEPHGISDAVWNQIQQNAINAIRSEDTIHYIVVGPANWNSYNNLSNLPVYTDKKLIYTFHFYDPFVFTHQGASWVEPSMEPLAGVPFPYNASGMPACPQSLRGSWIESALNAYPNEGNVEKVKQLIDIAVAFKNSRQVPVYCGEFGVYIPNSPPDDRVFWYQAVRSYLEEKGIPWTIWDYHGGFGIFNKNSAGLFEHDVNIPLINALALTPPPQTPFVLQPDTATIPLYTDYIEHGIEATGWISSGFISYYASSFPRIGSYCLDWFSPSQYNYMAFDFVPDKDLSLLVQRRYVVDFWFMGNKTDAVFDIRFLDTKTEDPSDHPWRMRYTINQQVVPFDGHWHHVKIPLAWFAEQGSWDNNQWYNPVGAFDWTRIDRFEVVAEHKSLPDVFLTFDNILITDSLATINNKKEADDMIFRIVPNPAGNYAQILFSATSQEAITIRIYSVTGNLIREWTLHPASGSNSIQWDLTDQNKRKVKQGMYFCSLFSGTEHKTARISVAP